MKLVISKPLTMELASQKMRPLIIRVNKPSVIILIGKVNNINTGLINALSKPRTRAAISADQKLANSIPGVK